MKIYTCEDLSDGKHLGELHAGKSTSSCSLHDWAWAQSRWSETAGFLVVTAGVTG